MTDLLFDPPWYLPTAFVLIASILFYQGNALQKRQFTTAGLVALILGVGIFLVGHFFESDQERVISETNQLVKAVNDNDWKTFKTLLDPKVRFAIYAGRDELTLGAQKTVDQVGVKNVTIGGIETKPEPGGFEITFVATADIEAIGSRAPTNWKLTWAKNPVGKNFLLYRVEALPNQEFGTEPVISRLAPP